jgi:hypothetical protein
MKLKLNLYPVAADIEEKIMQILKEASEKRARQLEIAYGEASVGVKKRILNFLNKKEIRRLYDRMEKTEKGWGRIYVYFRWS